MTSSGSTSELGADYADLVYNGLWYTPTREAIDAFVAKVQEKVTGVIRLKLFKGDCRVVGREFAIRAVRPRDGDATGARRVRSHGGEDS